MKKILILPIIFLALFTMPVFAQTLITINGQQANSQIYKELVRDENGNLWAVILTNIYNTSIYKSSDNGTTWIYVNYINWYDCMPHGAYHNYVYLINNTIYVATNWNGVTYLTGYDILTNENLSCIPFWNTAPTIESDGNNLYVSGRDENLKYVLITEIPFDLSTYTTYATSFAISPTYSYPYAYAKLKNNNTLSIIALADEENSESAYLEFYLNNKTFSSPISIKNQLGHGFTMSANGFVITDNENIFLVGKRNSYFQNDTENLLIYSLDNGSTWNAYYFNSTFNSLLPQTIGKYHNDVYVLLGANANSLYLYHYNNDTYTHLLDTGTYVGGQIRGGHTKQTTYNYFDRTESVNRLDILFTTYNENSHLGTYYLKFENNFVPEEKPIIAQEEPQTPKVAGFTGILFLILVSLMLGFILFVSRLLFDTENKDDFINYIVSIVVIFTILVTILSYILVIGAG